jgi:cytidylate kinase
MPKNILIFSDGTGRAGGLRPDENRSNIYKLYRATRGTGFGPEVRRRMVKLQQAMAEQQPVVAEGRDMSSVVFPDAEHKFYLDASVGERARRRALDLRQRGESPDEAALAADIAARDRRDSSRQAAPLRRVEGAVCVDTTRLTIEEVVERLLREMGHRP